MIDRNHKQFRLDLVKVHYKQPGSCIKTLSLGPQGDMKCFCKSCSITSYQMDTPHAGSKNQPIDYLWFTRCIYQLTACLLFGSYCGQELYDNILYVLFSSVASGTRIRRSAKCSAVGISTGGRLAEGISMRQQRAGHNMLGCHHLCEPWLGPALPVC
jgi:hypothetical protein